MIHWRVDFEIGEEVIDSQHRGLVDLINELEASLESSEKVIDINSVVERLIEYTHFHFTYEEEHMEKNHYDHLEAHKAQHKILIRQIIMLNSDIKNHNQNIINSIESILRKWLLDHILEQDKSYGSFLSGKQ